MKKSKKSNNVIIKKAKKEIKILKGKLSFLRNATDKIIKSKFK